MPNTHHPNEWVNTEHALQYLGRANSIPRRGEGEAALLEFIPTDAERILDLGTGDGRLLTLLRNERPSTEGVALDVSPAMLRAARERFRDDSKVQVLEHDLEEPLPDLGQFDAIVSSFAIHHVTDTRKKTLYTEIHEALCNSGVFCNLEHVAPASSALHRRFLRAFGTNEADEDPSNKLVRLEIQLDWLREIGFRDVDCHWKWLELALFAGVK